MLTKKLGEMIAVDEQPFSIVEDVGFLRYTAALECRYKVPSRKHFSQKVIPQMYTDVHEVVAQSIRDIPLLSFTTDMWTSSVNNRSFLGLTVHWITSDFNRRSAVLNAQPFEGHHTAVLISECMLTTMSDWQIAPARCHLVVRDSGANVVKALRDANLASVSCFAHTLQLTIKDALFSQRAVSDMIAVSRKIVGHFAHSPSASDRLRTLQLEDQQNGNSAKKLKQDVTTRWNSTYYMLQSLQGQRRVLRIYAMENEQFTILTPNQWDLLDKTVTLLHPFEEITREICRDDASISVVIPSVCALRAFLQHAGNDEGVQTMKASLLQSLNQRFTGLYTSAPHVIATILDPRYKLSPTCFNAEQKIASKAMLMQELAVRCVPEQSAATPNAESSSAADSMDEQGSKPPSSASVWDYLASSSHRYDGTDTQGTSTNATTTTDNHEAELNSYLATSSAVNRNSDPVLWWQSNHAAYNNLAKLAITYLAAPPSSVSSERLFSVTADINTPIRNRLSASNLDKLAFLRYNLPKVNFDY